ncbi:HD domain-containing protein [Methanosarcina barkeri]|nr:HD domain-containing protein [Methanosarcina barkeri]
MNKILTKFRPHALKIKDAGGTLYIVGGAVRRFLMCQTPHDVDFCVCGLTVDTFKDLFPDARQQGNQFPVFVVDDCEFAMARTEKKVCAGYNGFEINSDPSVTIEEDLCRRDLTINSIAIDVITGMIVDPFNGAEDLINGIITPTSDAFKEDPVRVIRAARFMCEYPTFRASPTLIMYMLDLVHEIKLISDDHKFSELKKVFSSPKPSRYFNILNLGHALYITFPEIYSLIGIPQAHHSDGDAFEHTMRVLDDCRELTDDPVCLFAALTHDLGKATTPTEILPAHHDHETRSVEIIDKIDWVPNEWKYFAKVFAADHMRGHRFREMRRGKRVSLLERIHKSNRGLEGFCKVLYADKPTPGTMRDIALMHATYAKIYSISGDDLPATTPKGEAFGKVLHQKRVEMI